MVQFLTALIYFLLLIMSIFLVCLVLIQRGKGGGLAGAFGAGGGGGSAFGSKAGDVFTRVTMISAGIWISLNMVLVILSNQRTSAWGDTPVPGSASQSAFTLSTDKNKTGDKAAAPATGNPAAASPFDALAPANPNTVAPSPLGKGATTPGKTTAPAPLGKGAATPGKTELPDAFPTESAVPPGSSPSGMPGNPKP